jgi:hypothetical protein
MNKGTLPVNTKYGYYKAGILVAEFGHGWGHYLKEYMEDNIF